MKRPDGESRTVPAKAAWIAAPIAGALFAITVIVLSAMRNDGYSHGTKAVGELGVIGARPHGGRSAPAFSGRRPCFGWDRYCHVILG